MRTLARVQTTRWTTDHIDELVKACQDPHIQAVLPVEGEYTRAVAHDFVTRIAPGFVRRLGMNLALVDETDRLAGCISLSRIDPETARIGYWVAATHRGQGVAVQAIDLIAEKASLHRYRRLELTISECNTGSRRVAEKAGFHVTEHLPNHHYRNGTTLPSLRYHRDVN